MGRRSLVLGTLAVLSVATSGGAQATRSVGSQPARTMERAQTIRWNALASASDTLEDAPLVKVWMEGTSVYSYGAPVRVWFNVSQDAYVIVARVDANGHLTLLYPASRTMSTGVEGGRDIPIRGRRGSASFYATDRVGGGFVFAMASYDPFDLSRLALRDFDRYVTGMYVGRPSRVYIGDPHRVVTRFASLVNFSDDSPFDYAVEYYNVDAPYWVSSAGFSNFCNGYYGGYRRGMAERWDDQLYYGDGYGGSADCNNFSGYGCSGLGWSPYGGYSFDYGMFGHINPACFLGRPPTNPQNPPVPPYTPPVDSSRVPGWLPDSIKGGRPDTVGTIPERRNGEALNNIRRQTTITEGPGRGTTVDADDPSRRSYAIPGRALRNSPMTFGEGRDRGGETSARPDRMNPTATGGPEIIWVRPPRDVVEGARNPYGSGALPRSPRSGSERGDGEFRGGRTTFVSGSEGRGPSRNEPRYEPPVRTQGPRFDTPPPNVRNSIDQPHYAPPPPRDYAPSHNPSAGGSSGGSGGGQVRTDPAPAPRSEPVRPAESGGGRPLSTEKKPDKP